MLSGIDQGKTGNVLHSYPSSGRVVIDGLNIVKKHARKKKAGEKGQIISMPRPVAVSKVILICPKCNQGTRIGYKISKLENKTEKLRICKKCEAEI